MDVSQHTRAGGCSGVNCQNWQFASCQTANFDSLPQAMFVLNVLLWIRHLNHWILDHVFPIMPWGFTATGEQLQHLAPKSAAAFISRGDRCLRRNDVRTRVRRIRQITNQHALCTNHQRLNLHKPFSRTCRNTDCCLRLYRCAGRVSAVLVLTRSQVNYLLVCSCFPKQNAYFIESKCF